MIKNLNINYYCSSYPFFCTDRAIADASSFYNYNNNYFFFAYNIIFSNWSKIDLKYDWLGFRNEIVKRFGLVIKQYIVKNKSDLITIIKSNIDNSIPLVMFVKYKYLFYSTNYVTHKQSHGIVVNGYDSQRNQIIFRDSSSLFDKNLYQLLNGDKDTSTLINTQLSEELFADIWEKSNASFKDEESQFYNKLYSVEKVDEPRISIFKDTIEDIILNYDFSQNNIINRFLNRDDNDKSIKYREFIYELVKNSFHTTFPILFDVIEKAIDMPKVGNKRMDNYYIFKEKFLQFRCSLIQKLFYNDYKAKLYNNEEKKEIVNKVHYMDIELYTIISDFYNEYLIKNE